MHPFEEREETVHEKTFRLSRVALTVLRKSAFVIPMGAIIPVMLRAADLGLRCVSLLFHRPRGISCQRQGRGTNLRHNFHARTVITRLCLLAEKQCRYARTGDGFKTDVIHSPLAYTPHDASWTSTPSLTALLSALTCHLTTTASIRTIRRFGPLGLGAWILRDDVKDAVNVVLRLMDAVPGVSMRDLAGGLYYLFTLRKGEQGCRPDAPAEEHGGCAEVRCVPPSSQKVGMRIRKRPISSRIVWNTPQAVPGLRSCVH